MKKTILICLAIVVLVAVSYMMFNNTCRRGAIRLELKEPGHTGAVSLAKSDIKSVVLQRMPYSTAKYQQFETIISVTPEAKQSLYSFSKSNSGKNVLVYFCDKLFADVVIVGPTDELRISSMNIDVEQTLKQLKKVTNNVEYKK